MNVHVRLLQYASKTFTYHVPDEWQNDITPGVLVQVPLGKRIIPAVVESVAAPYEQFAFKLRSINAVFPFPEDSHYTSFISKVAQYYQVDPLVLLRRVQMFLADTQEREYESVELDSTMSASVVLTGEQQYVIDAIRPTIQDLRHETFVLHGVTGSGKTEVYKKLAEQVLLQEKAVVILFPEVTLALRFQKIFSQSFAGIPVIGFHSAATMSQKKMMWQYLLDKKALIIIGVHLPILLPIAHLGLIVIDEEHDHGYQEKKHPKINSKDMAILKASMNNIPIVLGSATPSVASLFNIQEKGWTFLQMQHRFAGKFPTVKMLPLKQYKHQKSKFLHNELYHAIADRLDRKEQTIIFLNRRGYSFFVQCPCGYVFECHQCSVSLTLHQNNMLVCHYCGHREILVQECPSCKVHGDEFVKQGIGTQQVVSMLQKHFPSARIERADLDTTSKKRSWQQTVEAMYHKEIDILVGTQSITKGYHFPGVTLVGVLWADLNLHFPIYNASETTLQQLIQVAGRAGRQSDDSLVLIQAFDEHPIFEFIDETRYMQFYEYEIQNRLEAHYPPCGHIAEIELKHDDQSVLNQEASSIAMCMKNFAVIQGLECEVLGPVPALVHRVKKTYFVKFLLKSPSRKSLIQVFSSIKKLQLQSSAAFVIDPIS